MASTLETDGKPKTILYWNAFFKEKDFTFGFGQQPLIDAKCPVTSCHFTDDRSLFNASDIVIFSFQGLRSDDLPAHRFPHQRFVFYEMESPEHTFQWPMRENRTRYGFFNLTMTYRFDSDIVQRDSYGIVIPNNTTLSSFYSYPTNVSTMSRIHLKTTARVNFASKTKMIAWFVSHCKTASGREDYVRELSKYVPVDIYGKCGNLTCDNRLQCWKMLQKDYKFYIGFENSLCPDYVTEKLTRSLLYDAVPIVMGGVDYNRFAPPHSFINVFDFESPKQLADYLILLDRTDDLYARYFDWKRHFTVSTVTKQGWCRVCEIANDPDYPRKMYDIQKWWIDDAKCRPGWTVNEF